MSYRAPLLRDVAEIGVIRTSAGRSYRISVGRERNGKPFVDITSMVNRDGAWEPSGWGCRLPAKSLRDFALTFIKAADHLDGDYVAGGDQ